MPMTFSDAMVAGLVKTTMRFCLYSYTKINIIIIENNDRKINVVPNFPGLFNFKAIL